MLPRIRARRRLRTCSAAESRHLDSRPHARGMSRPGRCHGWRVGWARRAPWSTHGVGRVAKPSIEEGWPSGRAPACYAVVWYARAGSTPAPSALCSPSSPRLESSATGSRPVGSPGLDSRRAGASVDGRSSDADIVGKVGRVERHSATTSHIPMRKGGHWVWHSARKAVGALLQGVRFPPLPPFAHFVPPFRHIRGKPRGRAADCKSAVLARAGSTPAPRTTSARRVVGDQNPGTPSSRALIHSRSKYSELIFFAT